ncbi:MAG: SAF domain-containing protein [Anaerolineae bacterium]|nr:SAF domain-containing protein [Anaerolineae bacterium]
MRLGRLLVFLALILGIGLVAVYVIMRTMSNGGETVDGETPVQIDGDTILSEIVIVAQHIPRGGIVTEEALTTIAYPANEIITGMYLDVAEPVGLRARYDLQPGVPLMQGNLVGSSNELSATGSDWALLIPRGMVAIAIPVDRFSTVAYGLRDGDHVNVLATVLLTDIDPDFQTILPNTTSGVLQPGPNIFYTRDIDVQGNGNGQSNLIYSDAMRNIVAQAFSGGSIGIQGRTELDPVLNQPMYIVPIERQRPRMVSQTLLQDIIVLHVGNFDIAGSEDVDLDAPPAGDGTDGANQGTGDTLAEEEVVTDVVFPDIITLIVSPQDAVALNYLMLSGANLNLAMRSGGDDSRIFTEAVTLQYLMDQYNIPVPAKLPYGLEPRVDELISPGKDDFNTEVPPPQ